MTSTTQTIPWTPEEKDAGSSAAPTQGDNQAPPQAGNAAADVRLEMKGDRLHARVPGREEPIAVKVLYTRPLTERQEFVLMDEKHNEVAVFPGLHVLGETCRKLAEAALRERYLMPRITAVRNIHANFGTRYFEVETNHGTRRFALREPGKNITSITEDHLILRDTMGNRFEIPSMKALTLKDRKRIEAVL